MSPIFWIPTLVAIVVVALKLVDVIHSVKLERHVLAMVILSAGAYVLYISFYYVITQIFVSILGFAWVSSYSMVVHAVIVAVFIPMFFGLWVWGKGREKEPDLPTVLELRKWISDVGEMKEMVGDIKTAMVRAGESYVKTNERVNELEEEVREMQDFDEAIKTLDSSYTQANERINELYERVADSKDTLSNLTDQITDTHEGMHSLGEFMESIKGERADKVGESYQKDLARMLSRLGFRVETNLKDGPDLVVRDFEKGEPLTVVGVKNWSLPEQASITDQFDPEIEFAIETRIPFVIAFRNNLTGLEWFGIADAETLPDSISFDGPTHNWPKDLRRSTPSWLHGQEATREATRKSNESRSRFLGFLQSLTD